MKDKRFFAFLHQQIPVFIALSVLPGLGYLFLGWLNGVFVPAFAWYLLVIAASLWGYRLHRGLDFDVMSENRRERWYRQCSWFFYSFFMLWTLIFLLYIGQDAHKLHYIAIFTEIGASVVASSLLASDRRLYGPTIFMLMVPLIIYFLFIGEWYGYVLTAFACTLTWVLLYSANSSNRLLMQAHHQATHDGLTALHNRQYFIEHLQQRMNSLGESGNCSYLLLIDLDHFKTVNDSLGHDVGDRLLQDVVARLKRHVPAGDAIARLGGDEFIIAGGDFGDRPACHDAALALAEELVARLKESYIVDRHHLYISASIGVSILGGSSAKANTFIKEADIALYEVKAKGRDGVFVFNEEIARRVDRRLEIERLLHFAVASGEITLHYQPQIGDEGRVIGAESLARWDSPVLGPVSPAEFIAIAEQTGLIVELGRHILATAFRTVSEWHNRSLVLDQFSINISMRQLTHHDFEAEVDALARRYLDHGLSRKIVFEITESIVAEDVNRVIVIMKRLQESLGIRFSMDDFGTGYSSLSYLSRLPLDEIKIDRTFVCSLNQSADGEAMVTTILNMANVLKLNIVVEGVETAEQMDFLRRHDCHVFQGFYFSKPLPKEEFVAYCIGRK